MNENGWQYYLNENRYTIKDQRRRLSSPGKFEDYSPFCAKRERKHSDHVRYHSNSPSKRFPLSYLSQNKNLYKDQDAFLSSLLNRSHVKHRLLPPLDYEPNGITYSPKTYQSSKYPGSKQPAPLQHSLLPNMVDYEDDDNDKRSNSNNNPSPKIKRIKIKVKSNSRIDDNNINDEERIPLREHSLIKMNTSNDSMNVNSNNNQHFHQNDSTNKDLEESEEQNSTDDIVKSNSPRMKLLRSSLTNIPKKDSISEDSIQHNLSILQKFEELRHESFQKDNEDSLEAKKREQFCNCQLHNHPHNHIEAHKSPPPKPKGPPIKIQIIPRRKASLPEKAVIPKKPRSYNNLVKASPILEKEKTEINHVAEKEIENIEPKEVTPIPSPLPSESSDSEVEMEPECDIKTPEVIEDQSPPEEPIPPVEEVLPRIWLPPKTPNPLKGARMCLDSLKRSKEELIKTFKKIDKDMDGYVNFHQIKPEIPKELAQPEVYFVKQIFDITDNSTFFGLQEFILFMILCQKICFLDGPVRNAYSDMKDLDLRDVLTEFVAKFQKNETEPMSGITIDVMFEILFELRGKVKPSTVSLETINEIMDSGDPDDSGVVNSQSLIKNMISPAYMDSDQLYTHIYEELRLWNVTNCINKLDYISYLPFFISVCPNLQMNGTQMKARNILQ